MGVTCQWDPQECREEIPLQELAGHLATKHGHLLRRIRQEEGQTVRLSKVRFIMIRQDKAGVFRFNCRMERQAGRIVPAAAAQL